MILCTHSMWRARNSDHSVCLFYSHNKKWHHFIAVCMIKHSRRIFLKNSQGVQRFVGFFFLNCAFRMLNGHAAKLQSHGCPLWLWGTFLWGSITVLYHSSLYGVPGQFYWAPPLRETYLQYPVYWGCQKPQHQLQVHTHFVSPPRIPGEDH